MMHVQVVVINQTRLIAPAELFLTQQNRYLPLLNDVGSQPEGKGRSRGIFAAQMFIADQFTITENGLRQLIIDNIGSRIRLVTSRSISLMLTACFSKRKKPVFQFHLYPLVYKKCAALQVWHNPLQTLRWPA